MDRFRVERKPGPKDAVTLALFGRITSQHLEQLDEILMEAKASNPRVLLDLCAVYLLDRDVARFLRKWEDLGVEIVNPPAFVARWVRQCGSKD